MSHPCDDGSRHDTSRRRPAGGTPRVDARRDQVFRFHPASHLFAVIDDPAEADAAIGRLLDSGIPPNAIRTWTGPQGARVMDPTGAAHGRAARLWRTLQRLSTEGALIALYAEEARIGRVCIGIHGVSVEERQLAASILALKGGRLMSYVSFGAVQPVSPI